MWDAGTLWDPDQAWGQDVATQFVQFAPDAILNMTGLIGMVEDIQDSPDAPDADWLVVA